MFDRILKENEKFVLFVFLTQQKKGQSVWDLKKVFKIANVGSHLQDMKAMGAVFPHGDEWFVTHIGMDFFSKIIAPKLNEIAKLQGQPEARLKSDGHENKSYSNLEQPS